MDITQRKGGSTSRGKAEEKQRKSGDVGLMGRIVMVMTLALQDMYYCSDPTR